MPGWQRPSQSRTEIVWGLVVAVLFVVQGLGFRVSGCVGTVTTLDKKLLYPRQDALNLLFG